MFTDVKPGTWYYNLIARFLKMKAVSGYEDGSFKPNQNITRAETLSFIDKHRRRESALVKSLTPSIVTIRGKRSDGSGILGSGVVLDKQGYIATNCHVAIDGIDTWYELQVFFDSQPNTPYPARVPVGDLPQDIAILKVTCDESLLEPVRLTESLELLDEVYCIGNPLGYLDTASKGVVSCVERKIGGTVWIQTDAAINPGNSGGGAFNFLGELIGLPTWIIVWADAERTIPISNIGFIAPWYKVKQLYSQAVSGASFVVGTRINFTIL